MRRTKWRRARGGGGQCGGIWPCRLSAAGGQNFRREPAPLSAAPTRSRRAERSHARRPRFQERRWRACAAAKRETPAVAGAAPKPAQRSNPIRRRCSLVRRTPARAKPVCHPEAVPRGGPEDKPPEPVRFLPAAAAALRPEPNCRIHHPGAPGPVRRPRRRLEGELQPRACAASPLSSCCAGRRHRQLVL
jgi:hypothetical protein